MSVRSDSPVLFGGGKRISSDPSSSARPAKRRDLFAEERKIAQERANPELFMQSVISDRRVVLALDLDKCTLVGEDSCDIINAIGRLTDGYTKSKREIMDVAMQLVNPHLKPALDDLKKRHLDPLVVIYTMKGAVVDKVARLFQSLGLTPGFLTDFYNLKFDMTDIMNSFSYLTKQVENALPPGVSMGPFIKDNMDRLGVATLAISLVMGLPYAAPLFVTNANKDLNVISRGLGVPLDQIYLFDDKAVQHANKIGLSPEAAHMIPVKPFTLSSFDHQSGQHLQDSLRRYFPIDQQKFDPSFARMVTYAGEIPPPAAQSIARNPNGELEWRLSNLSEWPLSHHTMGYPLVEIPDAETRPPFRSRHSGRSFTQPTPP
jgi:hypothetical protein